MEGRQARRHLRRRLDLLELAQREGGEGRVDSQREGQVRDANMARPP